MREQIDENATAVERLQTLVVAGQKIVGEVTTALADLTSQVEQLKTESIGAEGLAALEQVEASIAAIDALIPDAGLGGEEPVDPPEEPADPPADGGGTDPVTPPATDGGGL